jgi:lysophospholipase L1-like esterase
MKHRKPFALLAALGLLASLVACQSTSKPDNAAPTSAAPATTTNTPNTPNSFIPPKQPRLELGHHSATTPVNRQNDWWMKRFNELSTRAQGFDGELIFIGDSITQGWENEGKEVWAKNFAPRGALNLGIGGDRTQHVLWRLANGNFDGIKPSRTGKRWVIIMVGTNNTGQGNDPNRNTPEQIADGIVAITQAVEDSMPDAKILLLGVFPRGEFPNPLREDIAIINGYIPMAQDRHRIFYKDIGSTFTTETGVITKDIMPDFLHLSPKGYQMWADAIAETIAK